jgi:L-rhamnonate dehydratase
LDAAASPCTPSAASILALWDLRGKIEGKPIHALLGGAKRDRLPAYGTIYPMAQTPDEVRDQVAAGQARNLRNFKFAADPWWLNDIAHTGRLLSAARQAGRRPGPSHRRRSTFSYRTAAEGLRLYPVYRDVGIWFLEAPLPLDDVEGHLEMSRHGLCHSASATSASPTSASSLK